MDKQFKQKPSLCLTQSKTKPWELVNLVPGALSLPRESTLLTAAYVSASF